MNKKAWKAGAVSALAVGAGLAAAASKRKKAGKVVKSASDYRNDSMCFDCDESDRLVFYRTGERYIVRTVVRTMPEIQLKLLRKESMVIF